MKMKPILPIVLLVSVGGCTVGPNYTKPPAAASQAIARGRFVRGDDPSVSAAPGLARWWDSLGDPTLAALVDDALAHSPNIDVAQARIREAGAQLRAQRASSLPSISASASYLNARLPGTSLGQESSGGSGDSGGDSGASDSASSLEFYNLGGTASWEPDLFGGGRRGVEQARATIGQRFADLADAQVSLSAQVAQAYVNLRDVEDRARLNARSTALQRQALALVRQRFAAGTASALDVERLQAQLESTDAQTIPLAAQRDEYRNQLALLTGREAGALDATLAPPAPVPLPPAQVAIGDPAALIARRPDIRAAERALAARTAAIGVSKARLFPSLSFMGLFGLGGTSLADIVDPGKFTALVAPMLSWSVLDFGKNQAAVRQSEAQRDTAEAQYRQTVLAALEDAETSLSRFGNVRRQLAENARAEATAARSVALNDQRVQAGTSTLIDQLDIERQRLSAAIAVAQSKAALTNSYIAVNKALGLGWTGGEH